MTRVLVNGKDEAVADGATIATLLEAHGLNGGWVVVEHNGDALERARFDDIELTEGDRVEIVRAVAGGA